jgi:DNA polymerase III alpha subunit
MAAVQEHKPGFYPLNTVLQEARHCRVRVLPVDIHHSDVKYRLEDGAIRVPLTQIKGLSVEAAAEIVLERATEPFQSLQDLYGRVRLGKDIWDNPARSGALDAFGERRHVLWQVGELICRIGPSSQAQLALDEA